MSPLWRDEISIYLSPFRLCLERIKRGLRPQLVSREDHPIAPLESPGWDTALEILGRKLTSLGGRGARVRIVVADHWVRYAVVPWSDQLNSMPEQLAHAHALLESSFGDDIADWKVVLTDAPPGDSRLACALPHDVLDTLRSVVESHGLELKSVQPQLVAAYTGWRTRLPANGPIWFVTVEQGALAALRTHAHGIDRVHSMRIGPDWSRELKRLQTFIRLGSEHSSKARLYLDAPRNLRMDLPQDSPVLHWLDDGAPPLTSRHRILALRGRTA